MPIRNLILKLRSRFSHKDSTFRQNINYNAAKKIGVLIYNPDRDFNQDINRFIKGLLAEGKEVEALCFTSKKNTIHYDFPCSYYSFKDIDWKGDFKREKINNFTKTEFDYLYSINISPFLPFKIVLQRSRAKFRIGKFEENGPLDLMIQINEQNLKALLEQMIIYSKKI